MADKPSAPALHRLVEWENDLWSSASYVKAALAAAKIYVRISDEPDLVKSAAISNDSKS